MTKPNGNAAVPLLNILASSWSDGRGCRLSQSTSGSTSSTVKVDGPGFLYRWDDNREPILITFVPEGIHETPTEGSQQYLVLEVTPDGLSARSSKRPAQTFKLSSPAHFQQLDEVIDEARNGMASPTSERGDTLPTIIAAQRLIALARHAHTNQANGSKVAKAPAKQRFVSDLHSWLSGQLENSVKLGDAAKHFKKSPRQLIRILKETTGSGFAEHLTMHRLTLARALLMRTDESIMDVARKSGFNSREQFIRSFSKAFSWTPLQFRKAWNKASLSNSDLKDLCQISERKAVTWHSPGSRPAGQTENGGTSPHTLIVANSLHEIVELFSIDTTGKRTRAGVLDRGAMEFICRDTIASKWLVRSSETNFERIFVTPDQHAVAVISSDL